MNRKLAIYIVTVAMFVVILTFVGMLSILAMIGISSFEDRNYQFDDFLLSADFLYAVSILTLLLIIILFCMMSFKDDLASLKNKGDGKNE